MSHFCSQGPSFAPLSLLPDLLAPAFQEMSGQLAYLDLHHGIACNKADILRLLTAVVMLKHQRDTTGLSLTDNPLTKVPRCIVINLPHYGISLRAS